MITKTSPYNPFDYLEIKEEINQYLNNAFMEDDPRIFFIPLGTLAKKRGMAQVERKAELNREPVKTANHMTEGIDVGSRHRSRIACY
jgi:probable addiction module antidote protein